MLKNPHVNAFLRLSPANDLRPNPHLVALLDDALDGERDLGLEGQDALEHAQELFSRSLEDGESDVVGREGRGEVGGEGGGERFGEGTGAFEELVELKDDGFVGTGAGWERRRIRGERGYGRAAVGSEGCFADVELTWT